MFLCCAPISSQTISGNKINYGVTFSWPHCKWLFDETRSPQSVLEELASAGIKNFRLEAYWNEIQANRFSDFNTNNLDIQLDILGKYNVKQIILCVGAKVPHWPEYHIPEWAQSLPEDEVQGKLLAYIERLVEYYSNDSRITIWQVENEPFFSFGDKKLKPFDMDSDFFAKEVQLVKECDNLNRKIIITDSGDKSDYSLAIENADILGLSYYGISCWKGIYLNHYPLRLWRGIHTSQKWKEKIESQVDSKEWIMIELQAEPWGSDDNKFLSLEESAKSMNVKRLHKHLQFVKDTGFSEIYFWGAEWWLWMVDKGHPEMWNEVKKIIKPDE